MNRCLAKRAIDLGGSLVPLVISKELSGGTGLMNPSIFLDGERILVLVRHTNYVLYHSEKIKFCHTYGPLQYLHPENDMHLRTDNFILELDRESLETINISKIATAKLDKPCDCVFIGLEDARLFRWEGKLFICGVRRDMDTRGTGRMQLSELSESFVELNRYVIPTPNGADSYCEKNWIPMLDDPFVFLKWLNPVEIVKYSIDNGNTETVFLDDSKPLAIADLRGGSQVLNYHGYRIAVVHETHSHSTPLGNKNATYRHRIIALDEKNQLVRKSELFSFMDAEIEFCCGLSLIDDMFVMSFGFQDNASFLLTVPQELLCSMVGI